MNKLKNKLLAHKALTIVMGLALVVGLAGVARAAGFSWSNVENNVADQLVEQIAEGSDEGIVGAVTSPNLPGPEFSVGMDRKWSVSMDLADATTTFAIAMPFRASTTTLSDVVVEYIVGTDNVGLTVPTSTVELTRLNFTSSTASAYQVGCGASASKYVTSTDAAYTILMSDSITAAIGDVSIENNLPVTAGARFGAGAVAKIQLGPSHPYLVCYVTSQEPLEWTGEDGVSPGTIAVRVSRVQ